MSAHPFTALEAEYALNWTRMSVKPASENLVNSTTRRLLRDLVRYAPVAAATRVPVPVIMCISEREMSGNLNRNLAQGDPLTAYSVHVPAGEPKVGHGPPFTFEEAAIRALQIDGLDKVQSWTVARALYELELYNGFGYRNHGVRSPYLWGGTSLQELGKYTSDGHWDPSHLDTQLGTAPLLRRIMEIDGSLKIPVGGATVIPFPGPMGPDTSPAPAGSPHDVWWLQRALLALGYDPLWIDGSFGRATRNAVVAYQRDHNLAVDGIPGTGETIPAIEADLKAHSLTIADGQQADTGPTQAVAA